MAGALPAGIVSRVQLSPYRVVLAGINTWRVDYLPLSREIVAAEAELKYAFAPAPIRPQGTSRPRRRMFNGAW
jgi:hypothetical protein